MNVEMRVQDPRVTRVSQWVGNILQGLIVIALGFVANNLWTLNLTMVDVLATTKSQGGAIADNKARIEYLERQYEGLSGRVYVLEGRSMRGHTENSRGN